MSVQDAENALAGAVSGISTRVVSTPLDVLKIRFQLQLEPIGKNSSSKYHGMLQATRTILREEGPLAFWKGFSPGLGLYALYGTVQFSAYEFTLRTIRLQHSMEEFVGGSVGGCAASLVCHPLDILRTRLVAQGEPKMYPSLIAAVRMMYSENGIRTFYKGLSPALLLNVPQTGIFFYFYKLFTNIWKICFITREGRVRSTGSMVCGFMSGMLSRVTVMPLDVVKKRIQVIGFEKAREPFGKVGRYTGVINCFIRIARTEGIRGFYKGTSVAVLKHSINVGVAFTAYNQALWYIREHHH